ncbi:MAG TPA: hypothetical protein VHE35_25345 [Kofleriaceae bacterium]|nr:hypothetical protein [Kofleriaceae bacterium]
MRLSPLYAFALLGVAGARAAAAGPVADPAADPAADVDGTAADDRQVALAAEVGMSAGGVTTPGGLRVAGHYLYRLADHDWFDSSLAFTFGSHGDACASASPAADAMPCDRHVTDGFAGDLSMGLRRELAPRRGFTPWLRAAAFARALRFDDVGGVAAGGELGAGVRAPIARDLALVAGANAFLGVARLGAPVDGGGRQLGLTVTVGAEVGMR